VADGPAQPAAAAGRANVRAGGGLFALGGHTRRRRALQLVARRLLALRTTQRAYTPCPRKGSWRKRALLIETSRTTKKSPTGGAEAPLYSGSGFEAQLDFGVQRAEDLEQGVERYIHRIGLQLGYLGLLHANERA
jgi:hypothetical protein